MPEWTRDNEHKKPNRLLNNFINLRKKLKINKRKMISNYLILKSNKLLIPTIMFLAIFLSLIIIWEFYFKKFLKQKLL